MAESYEFPVDGALNKTSLIKFDWLILAHISLNFIKTLMKVSLRDTNVYRRMGLSTKFTKIRH
ncbi:hypothetical protein CYJ96_01155 [Moraxella osloensis]|uniref:Uncharacterized protein n=1 Tax=Faucicola osloensis TaxID=34062 RepID=A0A2I1RLI0_FAUOS|nr:hypothetical protein CYJ96_01155 [Moraxella osloensis]